MALSATMPRQRVTEWVRQGMPFRVVAGRIDEMRELTEEQRAALWLWAWVNYQRRER